MKKLMNLTFALGLSITLLAGGPNTETYTVNSATSSLEWKGTKVTGSHEGTINIKEGTINVADGNIVDGVLTIEMRSIKVTDIKDEETNAKLKGHLVSDDFFGVKDHSTATLKINNVEQNGDQHYIHGELTLKGVTEKVKIPATIKIEDGKLVAIGTAEIDRTKYGIKYGSGSFFDNLGDKAIDNIFLVKFKVGAMS